MLELYGTSVSQGTAIGKIVFYSNFHQNIPQYSITDTNNELQRYTNALETAKIHLQSLCHQIQYRFSENEAAIFESHIMMLYDSKFVSSVENLIKQAKYNAELAVYTTALQLSDIFKQLDDEYLQQRYLDIIDVGNTLLDILNPPTTTLLDNHFEQPIIIAAAQILPSEIIRFKKELLSGIITNNGSQNSHTAILARMMKLPAITHISQSLSDFDGMTAVIDTQKDKIFIEPDNDTLARYKNLKNK